jgi:hypothetical protein
MMTKKLEVSLKRSTGSGNWLGLGAKKACI